MNFDILHTIEVLMVTPETLQALLVNLSDDWTGPSAEVGSIHSPKSKIQNGAWLPYDVLGHLIHGEETDWIPRARIILAQGADRRFVPFDRFAQFENSKGKSVRQLLDQFAKLRSENIDILRGWNLTGEQLDLEGMHPELGVVTLRQLLATWVVHDLNHVRQIVTAMAGRYTDDVGVWKEYLSILK